MDRDFVQAGSPVAAYLIKKQAKMLLTDMDSHGHLVGQHRLRIQPTKLF